MSPATLITCFKSEVPSSRPYRATSICASWPWRSTVASVISLRTALESVTVWLRSRTRCSTGSSRFARLLRSPRRASVPL